MALVADTAAFEGFRTLDKATPYRVEREVLAVENPWLRVEVTASTEWGKELALPAAAVWNQWARETLARLESVAPVIPSKKVREGHLGLPEVLTWQSEPELHVLCGPTGGLRLRGIEITTWQAIEVPRKWDHSSRRPDKRPDDQLTDMFKRLRTAMNVWKESMNHLTPVG